MRVFAFGVNRERLEAAAREAAVPVQVVANAEEANLVLTSKKYYRSKPQRVRDAENSGVPIYVLRNNAGPQMSQFLRTIFPREKDNIVKSAMHEAQVAAAEVGSGGEPMELGPQGAYIRRLQHMLAEQQGLSSRSSGKEPRRKVTIYRDRTRA